MADTVAADTGATKKPDMPNEAVRQQMREHFDVPLDSHAAQWASLWDQSFLPWDKGFPSPSLTELLSSPSKRGALARSDHVDKPSSRTQGASRKKRALVPGCGRGYDVALLAEHGYVATGVDISKGAVVAARKYWGERKPQQQPQQQQQQGKNENPAAAAPPPPAAAAVAAAGDGEVYFIEGDFFSDKWRGAGGSEVFDLIYDYTFLCALPPVLRPEWGRRMAELLRKAREGCGNDGDDDGDSGDSLGGHLVCLEFPLNKEPETGGPPWGLTSQVYDEVLGNAGLVLVERYRPEKFHEIGQGKDMVSIWRWGKQVEEVN